MAAGVLLSEDEIIKRKLLIDGDGIGDDRRINILLKTFIKWCSNKDETQEEKNLNYERILMMLTNCEHAMAKSQQMLLMNQLEMKNYEELYKRIEKGIFEAQMKIINCKNELLKAKLVRRNKQEYDSMANVIDQHPDRKGTLERLTLLEVEIKKLQAVKEDLNRKLEKRRKQFQVLLAAAHELQVLLQEEENNLSENMDQQPPNAQTADRPQAESKEKEPSKQPLLNSEEVMDVST